MVLDILILVFILTIVVVIATMGALVRNSRKDYQVLADQASILLTRTHLRQTDIDKALDRFGFLSNTKALQLFYYLYENNLHLHACEGCMQLYACDGAEQCEQDPEQACTECASIGIGKVKRG